MYSWSADSVDIHMKAKPNTRKLIFYASIGLIASSISYGTAFAKDDSASYPSGTITFIVPATPGGTTDVVARHVAKRLAERWNSPVLVENKAGAGGVIGATHVIKSKPDGHTVLVAPSALGVRSGLDKKLPYTAVRDLAGVALMAKTPSYLVVAPDLGLKTVADLKRYASSSKEEVMYASAGVGSTGHLHAAMLAGSQGFAASHVPYRGTPEAVTDTITKRVLYVFSPGPNALPMAKDGRAHILATTSQGGVGFASDLPVKPEVLTEDIGDDWYAAFVPAGTPDAVREKLSSAIAEVLASPDVKQSFASIGAEVHTSTPKQLDDMFRAYVATVEKIGEQASIKLD